MRDFVKEFIGRTPELDHTERVLVREALDELDDFSKVCELIEAKQDKTPHCPHCGATRIHRHGTRSGLQRYKCTGCSRTFNALTKSPLARLRKKELWLRYLDCMLQSTVLRSAGELLNIDKKTAFLWRHRFSTWLYRDVPRKLEGVVEADETYFRISKKGCRHLNREPRKRSSDNSVRGLSKKQVCVLTARDRSHHCLEFITGLGPVKGAWLDLMLVNKIAKDAVMVTDALQSYSHFCRKEHISHVIVRNKRGERVQGCYHIQHVNSFHSRIKSWINHHFRGVATKYLNHYLWWRHELENAQITDRVALFKAVLC